MELEDKLDKLLENTGDTSLKRRARKLILDLEFKKGDHVVDLGCGDGFYLYLLSSLPIKLKLTGFDSDQLVLKNAKKNLSTKIVKLINGNLLNTPFRNNTFTKAIMTEVLEHVEDEKKVLGEVYRILKPNGVLVLTVPNYNFPFLWDPINWILQNLFGTHISGIGFFAGIWARHQRLYQQTKLEKLIKNAGFKIEKVEQLTSRCLPFHHYLVNLVARLLYDSNLPARIKNPLSKFKSARKPFSIRVAYYLVNLFDKLNDVLPGRDGLNIYIKAIKLEIV